MTVICPICEEEMAQGEPIMRVAGQVIHQYCSLEGDAVCRDDRCQFWQCVHAGPCVL